MNLPTWLTVARVLMVPVLVGVWLIPAWWSFIASSALFSIAAITDWLDGYLARKWGQTTPFGAFLDPVADKLMVAVALVLLVGTHANMWMAVPAAVIIGREILVSALREWMAEMNRRGVVKVGNIGKFKTAAQMTAIIVLLAFAPDLDFWVVQFGYLALYVSAVLTLWSMVIYIRAAWPTLIAGVRHPPGG